MEEKQRTERKGEKLPELRGAERERDLQKAFPPRNENSDLQRVEIFHSVGFGQTAQVLATLSQVMQ